MDMQNLIPNETSIRDFLSALASQEGTHGAVSASAVSAGMGISLLLRAAALPRTRLESPEERTALLAAAASLAEIGEQLIETIETETAVKVFAARNMPRASDTERAQRQAAIQLALRAAADVPIEVLRLTAVALRHAGTIATRSSRAAAADVELAVALLHAAFTGARTNLETKLGTLGDAVYTNAVVEEMARLTEDATIAARFAEASARTPPA
jgi:methenyltetrahydrofolate cyclohydrolase